MPFQNDILGGASGQGGEYEIEKSLRFEDADNAFLTRTFPTPGNQKIFTISMWVKRGNLGTVQSLFCPTVGGDGSNESIFGFRSQDDLRFYDSGGNRCNFTTTQVFRDPNAWYHIVIAVDTTQATSSNRVNIYVNGEIVTAFATETYPTLNQKFGWNGGQAHYIGRNGHDTSGDYDGSISEFCFIDGLQYTASDFGETNAVTQQWIASDVSDLTFGDNGFFLKMTDRNLNTAMGDIHLTGRTQTYTVPASGVTSINVLVVAGGGGGGGQNAGGGGGGGVVNNTSYSVTANQVIELTVGNGGGAGLATPAKDMAGIKGENSTFGTITAIGGGGGGAGSDQAGSRHYGGDGGSGGGGSGYAGTTGVSGQGGSGDQGNSGGGTGYGEDGGTGKTTSKYCGGGGGGAGEVGEDGDDNGGDGGDGKTLATFSSYGANSGTFGGGGGGGVHWFQTPTGGSGGTGGGGSGGGSGSSVGSITAGTADTGGGGGGGWLGGTNEPGAAGGSGVVIVYDGTTYTEYTTLGINEVITAVGDGIVTRDVPKTIEAFTSTGASTWTCPTGVTSVEVLIVAGGGAGGSGPNGAGAGAGGIVHATDYTVVPGVVYDLTVGTGGATANYTVGGDGDDSVWNVNAEGSGIAMTAIGGGGGGAFGSSVTIYGRDGGSGGGNNGYAPVHDPGQTTQTSPTGAVGYGNDGGVNPAPNGNNYYLFMGGGGGAGEAGWDGNVPTGYSGKGGDGLGFSTFSAYGVSGVFGGGGGGGTTTPAETPGGGGAGGGGAGSYAATATSGTANTGGGGGGAAAITTTVGGQGGSGVILIAWAIPNSGRTSALRFPAGGNYAKVTDPDFNPGANWTYEMYWYTPLDPSTSAVNVEGGWGATSHNEPAIKMAIQHNGSNYGSIRFIGFLDNGYNASKYFQTTGATPLRKETWHHIVWSQAGSTNYIFVDGISQSVSTTSTPTFTQQTGDWGINALGPSTFSYNTNSWCTQIRLSKVTRYTSNFTPPTADFTTDSDTLLLVQSEFEGGLGADSSGKINDFDTENVLLADQLLDVPTNNFACLNNLVQISGSANAQTFSESNLRCKTNTSGAGGNCSSTINVSSGKWYAEFYLWDYSGGMNLGVAAGGVQEVMEISSKRWQYYGKTNQSWGWRSASGLNTNGNVTDTGIYLNYYDGDIVSIALDADNNKLYFAKNGTWLNSADPGAGTGGIALTAGLSDWNIGFTPTGDSSQWVDCIANFGQDSSFAGVLGSPISASAQDGNDKGDFMFTPPSGFLALCTDNLPEPEIKDSGKKFNTILYTGDGTTSQAQTGVGFSPAKVWIKQYNTDGQYNAWTNTTANMGDDKYLQVWVAQAVQSGSTASVQSFDSNGFTVGSGAQVGGDTKNYIAHNWAGAEAFSISSSGSQVASSGFRDVDAGFSMVVYDGNTNDPKSIGHGLSQAPELIFVKATSSSTAMRMSSSYQNMSNTPPRWSNPWQYVMGDGVTAGDTQALGVFNGQQPTASLFYASTEAYSGGNGTTYIAWCWHSVAGYSKIGGYCGNGSANGLVVNTGFRPALLICKKTNGSGNWAVLDSKRYPYNNIRNKLYMNGTDGVVTPETIVDFTATGFKWKIGDSTYNGDQDQYVYMAWAEYPFKYSNAR